MALYGYTVFAGIIIWCGVAMGTRGRAGIFVRGGGESQNAPHMYKIGPPICTKRPPPRMYKNAHHIYKKAPQMGKKVAKMPPHGKTSSQ